MPITSTNFANRKSVFMLTVDRTILSLESYRPVESYRRIRGTLMPPFTLFAIPKAFEGHIGVIQRNAILSWTHLQPTPEIFLFGTDAGTAEIAAELGLRHQPSVRQNELGTPLVSDVFQQAREMANSEILAYVNADLLLLNDFPTAIQKTFCSLPGEFLIIGRRIDLEITELLDFDSPHWREQLLEQKDAHGQLAPKVCKDYFVFPKHLFQELPDFAVGRANWDNWMVYHAHQTKTPVVDATRVATVLHQNHGYSHLKKGRAEAYIQGVEAKTNRALAGGTHLVKGSSANWVLTAAAECPARCFLFLPICHAS